MAIHIELREPHWSRQVRHCNGSMRPVLADKGAGGRKRSAAGKSAIEFLSKRLSRRLCFLLRYLLAHPAYCGETDQKATMP